MRVVVIGLGVQGQKRSKFAGKDLIATIDPINTAANYRDIRDISLNEYDIAIVCTPDQQKFQLLNYLLENKKHVLVEKPLNIGSKQKFKHLENLAKTNNLVCYTAYNHRFEPHFVNLKKIIDTNVLGKIYSCRMFYGNGTAKLVKDSHWRDKGSGVLFDLGSHLLDTCKFWFENLDMEFQLIASHNHENKTPDHVIISSEKNYPRIELEMTLCMWKNYFSCDLLAEKGSVHIESLCKWGPSKISFRKRVYPSGKPEEDCKILIQDDPTWSAEYEFFKNLILKKEKTNLENDIWINDVLQGLEENVKF